MKRRDHKIVAKRKNNLEKRLDRRSGYGTGKAVFAGGNLRYEMSDRTKGVEYGGIGAIHQMIQGLRLDQALNENLRLLKIRSPYYESDHILNMAYNILTGATCLEGVERLREKESYMDAIGAVRIPDPTTAGDFCRRFTDEESLVTLMEIFNDIRESVWDKQDESFFEEAVVDIDTTIAETNGECKEGIGLSYKGTWGYSPLLISLQNTGEPLYLVNRSGNTPSSKDIARWIDRALSRLSKRFNKTVLRGDTAISLTEKLDEWAERATFYFGYDAMPNLVKIADALERPCWKRLGRHPKYEVKTKPRGPRENVKDRIVEENGYKQLRLEQEDVAEFDYQPGNCKKTYRLVVVRKTIRVTQGQLELTPEVRYFFYITNNWTCSPEEVVFEANKRCDQENLFGQFHSGMHVMRMPLDNLYSNWAYMVIAALAWSLKAWYAMLAPDKQKSKQLLRMKFKTFRENIIQIPCQILKTGGEIVGRIISYNSWLRTFFDTFDVIRRMRCT